MFHDAELTDSVILMDLRITHGIGREKPLVVITTVCLINNATTVRLQDTKVLKRTAARYNMRLIPFGKLHSHSKRDKTELPSFHFNILSGPQVDPVRLAVNITQLFDFLIKILNLNLFHISSKTVHYAASILTFICSSQGSESQVFFEDLQVMPVHQ